VRVDGILFVQLLEIGLKLEEQIVMILMCTFQEVPQCLLFSLAERTQLG